MAQQIQFIYLTQSDYDSLNPKNTGRIYFTSDTHRIYKGSDLYAATTFDQLNFSAISASSITVDGNAVSLEGHTHTMSDIEDYEDNTFWVTGTANPTTLEVQMDQDFEDVVEAADAGKHIRAKLLFGGSESNGAYVCPWVNLIYTNDGSVREVAFHIMLDANNLNPDQNWHPYLLGVFWNSNGFTVRPYELAQTSETPEEIWESGEETDSARRIISTSTPVVTGSESTVISQGALTTGVANVAGLKGYRYTNTGNVTNSLTFATSPTGWAVGDVVSIVNNEKYENCATIASISGTTVTFTENLPFTSIEDDNGWDAKLVYVSEKPTVGDIEIGYGAYAEGLGTKALNVATHAEGMGTKALGQYAHAEGRETQAQYAAHAEGYGTQATEEQAHSEGYYTTASGKHSHAEGCRTNATKTCAHSEGENTTASGNQSHSEGYNTTASASQTHAEGNNTKATANQAHAEGNNTTASGTQSHAEGFNTTSEGGHSHSEGSWTNSGGNFSHAEGRYTKTQNAAEHAEGQYNKSNKANTNFGNAGNTIHSIGIGTTDSNRKNAVEVMQNGKVFIKDAGGYDGTNPTGSGVKDIATILSTVASSAHTHPELSGITQSTITKDTGTFTNLVVTNASLDATSITASGVEVNGGIQASTVSASSATFQTLTVTGEVTMSLSSVDFQNINASSLTVNGSAVSLEGHSHSASEISGLDAVISAATSSFASSEHTHDISDITSLATKVSGLTSSKVEKTNGVFTNLSTTNLVVSSASIDAVSIEASSMTVNGTGTFNAVSASTATFGDINVTGTASLSATHVSASTLTADSGTFTNLTVVSASFEATSIEASTIVTSSITVGGSAVALVGHTHPASEVTGLQSVLDGLSSTYASISHGHAISDITNLSTVLTGITEIDIEKDTVTADIGYFRLLSVSGSANFAVNTVSANAVTVNGTEVALSGHTHSIADIDGLSTALGGFASSGHTHGELTGITQTSISKDNANFTTVSASAGTFNTITTSDLNFTNLSISSAVVSSMTVTNLNVTNTLKLNNKDIATQEYVQLMISQAIGQALASAY